MPGITDQLVSPKHSRMRGDDFAMSHDAHLIRCGADGNRLTGYAGRNAISITIHPDQASRRDSHHLLNIAIEVRGDRTQQRLLIGKACCDGALLLYGMVALRQFFAADSEPVVQGGK